LRVMCTDYSTLTADNPESRNRSSVYVIRCIVYHAVPFNNTRQKGFRVICVLL